MRLIVDGQVLQSGSREREIGRYSRNLLLAIVRNHPNVNVTIVLSGALPQTIEPVRDFFDDVLPQSNIVVSPMAGNLRVVQDRRNTLRSVYEVIQHEFFAAIKPDAVLTLSVVEAATDNLVPYLPLPARPTSWLHAALLFDVLPLEMPHSLLSNSIERHHYMSHIEAMAKCDVLLAASKTTRDVFLRHVPQPAGKLIVIGGGFDHITERNFQAPTAFTNIHVDVAEVINRPSPFILCVGGNRGDLPVEHVIDAILRSERVRRESVVLVFVGLQGDHRNTVIDKAERDGLPDGFITVIDRVSEVDLQRLFETAALTVCASVAEGFALTPVEAASAGSSVIVGSNAAVREFLPDERLWFDPCSSESLIKKIDDTLLDSNYRDFSVRTILALAAERRWDTVASLAVTSLQARRFAATFDDGPVSSQVRPLERLGSPLEPQISMARRRMVGSAQEYDASDAELVTIACSIAEVLRLSLTQRWDLYVDVSALYATDAGTGIQRVSRNILFALREAGDQLGFGVRPVAGRFNAEKFVYHELLGAEPFLPVAAATIGSPIRPRNGDVWLGLDLGLDTDVEFVRSMRELGVRTVFIVYDLLPARAPYFWPQSGGLPTAFRRWLGAVAAADGCICISESVAQDLAEWLKELPVSASPLRRRRRFALGWSHLSGSMDVFGGHRGFGATEAPKATEVSRDGWQSAAPDPGVRTIPSFLMVGTYEPRKGHKQVLSSFMKLWRDGHQLRLIFAGRPGWMMDEFMPYARRVSEENPLFELYESPDEGELRALYQRSDCVVVGSFGEGFGLPIVEAFAHRRPVLARDLAVFREIAGDNARYFSGVSGEGLEQCLLQWVDDNAAGLIARPEPWNRSWSQVVSDYLVLMRAVPGSLQGLNQRHAGLQFMDREWA